MSILTVGDPHFQMSNMDEVKAFVRACLAHARRTSPFRIVVLGDVLHDHERVHSTVLNVAVNFLNALSAIAPTWVLVGNHDLINNSQFLTENHWMNALKMNERLTVVDHVVHEEWKGKKVVMVPFVPPGRFVEALETAEDKAWHDASLIFAHQEFKGVKMGCIVSEVGDAWDEKWPFVVTGHIHQNQTPQPNVYYPGSAIQVAFGESEMNIVAEVSLSDTTRQGVEEVDLGLIRKKIVYTDATVQRMNKILKTLEPGGSHANHKLKVCVDGTKEEFKALKKTAAFKKLEKKGVKVVYKRKRATITAENMAVVGEVEKMASGEGGAASFADILCRIVNQSPSTELKHAYSAVIRNPPGVVQRR